MLLDLTERFAKAAGTIAEARAIAKNNRPAMPYQNGSGEDVDPVKKEELQMQQMKYANGHVALCTVDNLYREAAMLVADAADDIHVANGYLGGEKDWVGRKWADRL